MIENDLPVVVPGMEMLWSTSVVNTMLPPSVVVPFTVSVPELARVRSAFTSAPDTVRNRSIVPVSVSFTLNDVLVSVSPWPAVYVPPELPAVESVPHEKRPVVASQSSLLVAPVSQSVRPAPEKDLVA